MAQGIGLKDKGQKQALAVGYAIGCC